MLLRLPFDVVATIARMLYENLDARDIELGGNLALFSACRDIYFPLRALLPRVQYFRGVSSLCAYIKVYEESMRDVNMYCFATCPHENCKWLETRLDWVREEEGLTEYELERVELTVQKSYADRIQSIEDTCLALESNPFFELTGLLCTEIL